MKIKRFFAKEMRQGIKQVRDALGADAVILSNNKVEGGIEIIAAVDYDESLLQPDALGDELAAHRSSQTTAAQAAEHVAIMQDEERELANDTLQLNSVSLPDLKLSAMQDAMATPGEIPRPVKPAQAAVETPRKKTAREKPSPNKIQWSQDPAIIELKDEINGMRDLLEQQLASLAWGDLNRRDPMRAKLTRCLLELGLSPTVCERVADAATEHKEFDKAWRHALAILAHSLPADSTDILDQGGVVALVGATGVGKTTTIAKLAARYALKHGSERVAMVTTDGYRIAAHEQLRTYGRILDIPVRIANTHEELVESLKLLSDRDLVLVDTAGMSQRDMRLSQQFQMIKGSTPEIKTYLVLSATTHRAGLREIAKAFGEINLDGCIITKLDETTSLGGALSAVMEHGIPVSYVSDGQRVPEDIHIARGHSLINRAVLIAQETNQALKQESLNLAFSGMVANAHG
ncbi:MAG TPA: flagellar biosynthesis protein FlhF [Gammaproteobacteria bacterium]|nr:flagellar biosynthesis protein FlhF [Gammaproteobacteria bacterium]